ncbi:hypothetical protein JB92DRAFT_3087081 [Gautieria morchelliformis]|nr:hypothetical protein JB92DRAFT_3087081 [Gautieria morchelliformis]
MSPTQFKLVQTGRNALMRRVTFAEQPTWFSLASRIEGLYGIPLQDVGVSYIDTDGDEITLSTHEELRDYYVTVSSGCNSPIKFTVKNIGHMRAQHRANPPHQPSSGNNMFEFIVEDDWRPFSRSDAPPPPPPKSPSSAFVETVSSSVTVEPPARSDTSSPLNLVEAGEKNENVPQVKGRFLAVSDSSDASSVSVLHDDVPDKQPVHVYEYDTEQGYVREESRSRSSRLSKPLTPQPFIIRPPSISRSDSSSRTPSPLMRGRMGPRSVSPSRSRSGSYSRVVPVLHMTPPSSKGFPSPKVNAHPLPDPPSPVLPSGPSIPDGQSRQRNLPEAAPSPSLTKDVADLLNALTNAFGAHPELSEGLKNIVRNAGQGAYWAAERDAMVNDAIRAAESAQDGLAQAAEHAQEEAGRKVSEALNGVFKALGSIINNSTMDRPLQPIIIEHAYTRDRSLSPIVRARPLSRSPVRSLSRHRAAADSPVRVDSGRPDGGPIAPPDPYPLRSSPPPGHYQCRPPPPGPPFAHFHGPPHMRYHYPGPPPPPPPRPLPLGSAHPRAFEPVFGHQRMYSRGWAGPHEPLQGLRRSNTLPGRFGGPGVGPVGPPPFGPHYIPPLIRSSSSRMPQPPHTTTIPSSARKAQLEEAKEYYKATKEEWRREKEARRKEKELREARRMERIKQREMRGAPIRQVMVYSDVEEEEENRPPPVPLVF